MNKINTFQIYLLLWLFPFLGNAQAGYPEEQLLLHTDRELYISGETVWFKVYALEQDETSLSNFSKVAYLELINQKGLSLSRVKLELVDGLGIGTIELPSILKSGPYILRSYTQAMRNLEYPNFGDKKLIILHPTQALVQASEKDTTIVQPFLEKKNTAEKRPTQQLSIGVQSNKEQYGQRELLQEKQLWFILLFQTK